MIVNKEKPEAHFKEALSIYWRATWRYKKDTLLTLLLPISSILLGVGIPFFASKVIANLIAHSDRVWTDFWLLVSAATIGVILNGIGIRRCMKLQARVMDDLHDLVFGRLLQRSVGFFNNRVGGGLVSDALDFISSYGRLFEAGFVSMISFLATVLIGVMVVLVSNWIMGVLVIVLILGLAIWTMKENKHRSTLRTARLRVSKRLTSHLSDNIVNAVTVKTFAREQYETKIGRSYSRDLAEARLHDWTRTVTNETQRMSLLIGLQVLLVFVLIEATRRDPQLLAAGIFAFTYTVTLIGRFFTINSTLRQIEDSLLEASPIAELLQQPYEIEDKAGAPELKVTKGEIVLHEVHFAYDDAAEQAVFASLNLSLIGGQKVGLVGHSGGGKSTLTRLVLRFEDVTSGSITIDGQDIRDVTQASLRDQIAYVPQEPLLFHRSVKENITYGKPGATDAEIEAAAKKAYALDFITALPDGFDTIVGERGVKLSGGQRQRIAIARAMLKDAPILILDEATSALDSESEKAIQQALWKLMEHKTTLVIAHRLSTIQRLDRILVLDDGKIIEDGTHNQLLKHGGQYARLWKHQSGGFIEE